MSELAQRLDTMLVRVATPSRGVFAELRGRAGVLVWFAVGFYRRVRERDLETQLAVAARLLWVARIREYDRILTDMYQQPMAGEDKPISLRDVDFFQRRARLIAEGQSGDGRIRVSVRGMHQWTVKIASGTLRLLPEEQFTAQASQAASALIDDQQQKIRELRQHIYNRDLNHNIY